MNRNFIRIKYTGGVEVNSSAIKAITLDPILFFKQIKMDDSEQSYSAGTVLVQCRYT